MKIFEVIFWNYMDISCIFVYLEHQTRDFLNSCLVLILETPDQKTKAPLM